MCKKAYVTGGWVLIENGVEKCFVIRVLLAANLLQF